MKILKSRDERLLSCALKGNSKGVISALDHGANVNARDKQGWSAWMLAYANHHSEARSIVESRGAIVTEQDRMSAQIRFKLNSAVSALPSRHGHMRLART